MERGKEKVKSVGGDSFASSWERLGGGEGSLLTEYIFKEGSRQGWKGQCVSECDCVSSHAACCSTTSPSTVSEHTET